MLYRLKSNPSPWSSADVKRIHSLAVRRRNDLESGATEVEADHGDKPTASHHDPATEPS